MRDTSTTTGDSTPFLVCGQRCRDDAVGYAIDYTMWLIWNETFAGAASGSQDKTVTCPLGGTAHITGTTSVASNGINTLHLALDLEQCGSSSASFRLSFTGALRWDGTFGGGAANAVTFSSSSLEVSGVVEHYDEPTVNETCPVALTDTNAGSSSAQAEWLAGEVCGRPVLQPEDGSSAGSTSGGTSGDSSGGGGSGGSSGGEGTRCMYPRARLAVNVSPRECAACTKIAIVAKSPQITAAIAAGKSPCSEGLAGADGCAMGQILVRSFGECGGTACGPYDIDLSTEFNGATPITDTVSFCPFDDGGGALTPIGTCVSSLVDQCSPSATITVIIN